MTARAASTAPETTAPATPADTVLPDDAILEEDGLVEEDLLVEDVSIDGMCGVY
jgi:mycofactocin precursor